MNIGPTEFVIVLLIFAVPVAAIALVVIASRAGRRTCPVCGEQVVRRAEACARCGTALAD